MDTQVRVDWRASLGDVFSQLREQVEKVDGVDYFHCDFRLTDHRNDVFEDIVGSYTWVAVFPVEGSNEGHYVHVDLIGGSPRPATPGPYTRYRHLFLAKTFGGAESAQQIAKTLQDMLDIL
jgi:hypothetical protein